MVWSNKNSSYYKEEGRKVAGGVKINGRNVHTLCRQGGSVKTTIEGGKKIGRTGILMTGMIDGRKEGRQDGDSDGLKDMRGEKEGRKKPGEGTDLQSSLCTHLLPLSTMTHPALKEGRRGIKKYEVRKDGHKMERRGYEGRKA
jgi:hypothetical protein